MPACLLFCMPCAFWKAVCFKRNELAPKRGKILSFYYRSLFRKRQKQFLQDCLPWKCEHPLKLNKIERKQFNMQCSLWKTNIELNCVCPQVIYELNLSSGKIVITHIVCLLHNTKNFFCKDLNFRGGISSTENCWYFSYFSTKKICFWYSLDLSWQNSCGEYPQHTFYGEIWAQLFKTNDVIS